MIKQSLTGGSGHHSHELVVSVDDGRNSIHICNILGDHESLDVDGCPSAISLRTAGGRSQCSLSAAITERSTATIRFR